MPEVETARATTRWVKVSQVVPHPDNTNRLPGDAYERLCANLDAARDAQGVPMVPPILVRSLEKSTQFVQEHEAGMLQVLDGEHRLRYFVEHQLEEIEVKIWPGITDAQAWTYLLTMNDIGRTKNRDKRRRLIAGLLDITHDPEGLAALLPDNLDEIQSAARETAVRASEAAASTRERAARSAVDREVFTCFMGHAQKETVNRAIKGMMAEMDPEHQRVECREGEALAAICRRYLGTDE